jgi:hypothetical protein
MDIAILGTAQDALNVRAAGAFPLGAGSIGIARADQVCRASRLIYPLIEFSLNFHNLCIDHTK